MNRKQKKAKRLRATQHTKQQNMINLTPHEERSMKYDLWDAEWFEPDEPPKSTAKWVFCIVLICMLITLWMFKINA